MKIKLISLLCSAALLCTACSAPQTAVSATDAQSNAASAATKQTAKPLTVLRDDYSMTAENEGGFYTVESPQSNQYQNIMYYDYNTMAQRYLCDVPNCTHDHKGCTSFLSTTGGTFPMAFGDKLYVLYHYYDDGTSDKNLWKPAIEQRNADGTGAQVLIQGDEKLRGGVAVTDGDAWYWTVGSEGKTVLIRFSLTDKTLTEVGVLPNNTITLAESWNGKQLALQYGTGNDPANGTKLYAISMQDASMELLHTWDGNTFCFLTAQLYDGKFLYTDRTNGDIRAYDLASDTDAVFTNIFAKKAVQMADATMTTGWGGGQILDDWMIVQGNMRNSEIITCLAGEVKEITLGDFWNGYVHPITIWKNTSHGALVTEEHRPRTVNTTGTGGEPYTFESDFWVYAFLSVDDLVHSVPNYREITPVPYTGAH